MTKAEFVAEVAKRCAGITRGDVETVLDSMEYVIMDYAVKRRDDVPFGCLGKFSRKDCKKRKGFDPYHRKEIDIEPTFTLKFTAYPRVRRLLEDNEEK